MNGSIKSSPKKTGEKELVLRESVEDAYGPKSSTITLSSPKPKNKDNLVIKMLLK